MELIQIIFSIITFLTLTSFSLIIVSYYSFKIKDKGKVKPFLFNSESSFSLEPIFLKSESLKNENHNYKKTAHYQETSKKYSKFQFVNEAPVINNSRFQIINNFQKSLNNRSINRDKSNFKRFEFLN
ncbi:MAG: hypothetical protein ABI550_06285 [Ignavibacteriaceae bacterium]